MTVPPELAHDRAGSGATLVLIHPLGGYRGVWQPVWDRLAARHDVIAVDMPGFGESPELPTDTPPTARNLAAAILAQLDRLGVDEFHVAGNSLGGWTALELAKRERARSVTTLCAAGFWSRILGPRPEVARGAARVAVPLLRPLLSTAAGRRLALSGVTAHPERVPARAAFELVRSYGVSRGYARANAEMRKALFTGFEEIPGPVTMAWGERDRLVHPPRTAPPEGVRQLELPDCGHVPMWDHPELVAEVILAGIARAAGERSTAV